MDNFEKQRFAPVEGDGTTEEEITWDEGSQVNLLGVGAGAGDRGAALIRMQHLMQINSVKLSPQRAVAQQHHMVAVDGSPASWRAFEVALRQLGPDQHLYVVHIRRRTSPIEAGYLAWNECPDTSMPIRMDFDKWKQAREVARTYAHHLARMQPPPQNVSVIFPAAYDVRKGVCALATQLGCSTLLLGRHTDADKAYRVKNSHFRSFRHYCTHHVSSSRCRVAVI